MLTLDQGGMEDYGPLIGTLVIKSVAVAIGPPLLLADEAGGGAACGAVSNAITRDVRLFNA